MSKMHHHKLTDGRIKSKFSINHFITFSFLFVHNWRHLKKIYSTEAGCLKPILYKVWMKIIWLIIDSLIGENFAADQSCIPWHVLVRWPSYGASRLKELKKHDRHGLDGVHYHTQLYSPNEWQIHIRNINITLQQKILAAPEVTV